MNRLACALLPLAIACGGSGPASSECGPARARVARVVDGDTVVLASGDPVRYLLVDTPELSADRAQCYGAEARDFNQALVEGREVALSYDRECRDRYHRLLAYLEVEGRDVNAELVARGYGRILQVPPNGEERVDRYRLLEGAARAGGFGLWGRCR